MPVMTTQFKEWIKDQVKVYLRKYGNDRSLQEIKAFILEGDQGVFDLSLFPTSQINKFIRYQKAKIIEHGSLKDLSSNNGGKSPKLGLRLVFATQLSAELYTEMDTRALLLEVLRVSEYFI